MKIINEELLPRTDTELLNNEIAFFKNDSNYEMLFDKIPDWILILNNNRQTVFLNKSMLKYFELNDREVLYGKRPGEIFGCVRTKDGVGCGTAQGCKYCGALVSILTGLNGLENSQECRMSQINGDSLTLRVTSSPFKRNGSNFIIFSMADISDEKRREVLEKLFFHDIMNTASGIQSIGEIMKMELPPEYDEYSSMLSQASRQLIDEIRNQRQLLAAEKGTLAFDISEINVRQLIKEIIDINKHFEFAQECTIIYEELTKNSVINTDKALLGRTISNLLKNALEAVAPRGTVKISSAFEDGKLEVSVHNSIVMPDEIKQQIFQKSFSTKGSGRGIGTYSIKLFTEKYLGGSVWFTSEEGMGTTFYISIPDSETNSKE